MRFSLRDPTQLPGACLARPQNVCTTTAETTARRIANHFGAPWVADLTVATRPLYALHCRVIDLEAAIDVAVSLLQQDKP
ncbi:MAG TPA: hypothetical protein VNO18_02630, partial [Xanthobacteraceae bacterium]|nr:hypothetical protein [Xanthobacteraceae bacterium]